MQKRLLQKNEQISVFYFQCSATLSVVHDDHVVLISHMEYGTSSLLQTGRKIHEFFFLF